MIRVLTKLYLAFLFLFFWQRILFLISFHDQLTTPMTVLTMLQVVFTGLRFDLMVLAFISAPALVAAFFSLLLKNNYQGLIWKGIRGYYLLMIVVISFITLIDLLWFQVSHDRWNQTLNVSTFLSTYKFSVFFVCVTAALLYLGYEAAQRIMYTQFEFAVTSGWLGWGAWLVLAAVTARGTFAENHLDLRHAQITNVEYLNRAVIPSSYAFEQALRGRR